MEAWGWLAREGLIAPRPGNPGGDAFFVTRRGHQVTEGGDTGSYQHAQMLPRELLHPVIAQKVWATFLRGDYDTAVFQAFKEVEVRTRQAANLANEDIGVSLVRKAFNVESGPLTDSTLPAAERQALSDLFAGGVGSYKNPGSHRHVAIEASEAVEMIVLASHLLRIVDDRSIGQGASN